MNNETVLALTWANNKQSVTKFLSGNGDIRFDGVERYIENAREILKRQEMDGIVTINASQDSFPRRLKEIGVPILHTKGDLSLLFGENRISVVGDRKVSLQGTMVAFILGARVSEYATVVSGLANGCDTFAHKGCIHAGGKTIAVLPSPLNDVFPPEKKGLSGKILESGGLLVSEYPIGMKVRESFFEERDRVQVALSQGVVVAEAHKGQGTRFTIGCCFNQGVPLGCFSGAGSLNEWLLKQGKAVSVSTPAEVAEFAKVVQKKDA